MDIGKFSMTGSHERTCIHSEWTNTKPVCSGLNQENDYASRYLAFPFGITMLTDGALVYK